MANSRTGGSVDIGRQQGTDYQSGIPLFIRRGRSRQGAVRGAGCQPAVLEAGWQPARTRSTHATHRPAPTPGRHHRPTDCRHARRAGDRRRDRRGGRRPRRGHARPARRAWSSSTTSPSAPAADRAGCCTAGCATWPRGGSAWSARPAARSGSCTASPRTWPSRCRSSFPTYRGTPWPLWQLRIGVKLYDLLCGGRNLGPSRSFDATRNAGATCRA